MEKKRIYTNYEINELKKCKFVENIKYGNHIEYNPLFNLWCVMMRIEKQELSAREIFERGGMNIDILSRDLPRKRIKEWVYNYERYGAEYFLSQKDFYTISDKFEQQLYKILEDRL